MIGVLGSTCDPTVLVSGSLAALRGDADELEARAGALADASDDVEHRIVEAWIGDSADAYAARRRTLTDGLRSVAQVHAIAVAVLRVHADRLEWGQSRAQIAIDLWDRGCAATTATPRRIGSRGPREPADPGTSCRRDHDPTVGCRRLPVRRPRSAPSRS